MYRTAIVASACILSCAALAADAGPTLKGSPQYHLRQGEAQNPQITAQIAKADSALFDAVFVQCDSAKVAATLTDDFRFVHDKDGASTRAEFVANLKGHCERVAKGVDFPARRELVPGSLEVWPIDKYGALEIGVHRFYARLPGKPEQLTETGNFMILWKRAGDEWRMAESISYGHQLAR